MKPARGPTLRLVCVNDVYTLENLPRLRTLVQSAAKDDPADALLVTLAGDFVGPSMLSSLDQGRGMVDCMNAVPVTHVCLGNHEDDVPMASLRERIAELDAVWLSTNVLGLDPHLKTSSIVEVGGGETRTVRVGLIGVVMHDPSAYRGPPFGGATILPANDAALAAAAHLVESEGCACVVPLTHQDAASDRALAGARGARSFPVIVGGHEHVPLLEQVGSTWIVKAGADAVRAVVVDLVFPIEAPAPGAPDLPTTTARLVEVAPYPEDAALRARVDQHMRAVHALEAATLIHLDPGHSLSSIGSRARQTSLGSLICSRLRDALGAEACVFNGGGIRGQRDYQNHFTYGDLEAEVPFENEVVVVSLPGRVLRDALVSSRARAPAESGGYLQLDDAAAVDAGGELVAVAGAPFDMQRDYRVAMVRNLFEGMDHIEPLVRFAREQPDRIPPVGSGRDAKVILIEAFCDALWCQLGDFDAIDQNRDGSLDAAEIAAAVARATTEPASSITVDLLLKMLDENGDHRISRDEAVRPPGLPKGP